MQVPWGSARAFLRHRRAVSRQYHSDGAARHAAPHGYRRGRPREDVSFGATPDPVPSPATMCTRVPSRRSSGGLTTTALPSASPPVTSTQLPRSRPRVTVWYRAVESGATVTTCGGPSRITSAVAGTRSGGLPAPSASCTWAYIPGRNTPVGLATRTSVSSVRAVASSAPAVRATRPRSVSPGSAGTVTTAGFPIATAAALSSGTVTYTLRVSVCATVNRLPGALPAAAVSVPLTPPAVPTSAPASTLRAVMTPANGATTRSYACSCTSRWRLASALFELATASLKAA